MGKMTGYRYLAEAFQAYGVTHTFMVPTVVVRALVEMETLGITTVMTHGEKAAAYMADGYARVSGRPGVCLAQTVGAANLAAGLRDAYLASSPVLALTGGRTPETAYRNVYQEIADFPLYEPLTKMNVELDTVERLPDLLRQAFRALTSGVPGPVHLELRGVQGEVLGDELELDDASGPLAEPRYARVPAFRPVPERADLEAALDALARAQRPVIVAGNGAVRSGAADALAAFAEAAQIPVATSLHAKGLLPEDHPLSVGVVGGYSRPTGNQAVGEADLVFFIGSGTGSQTTGGWHLPEHGTPVIQCDLDPLELGRNYPNVASLLGDARATLEALVGLVANPPDRRDWIARCAAIVGAWRDAHAEVFSSNARPMRPERVLRAITEVLPDDGVLLADTGHSGIWAAGYVDLKSSQTFLRAAGSLGWSFPAALGAKCGAPDRPVVCFTGDGAAYYHLAELETAVRHDIGAVIVVNDNRAYGQDFGPFERAYEGNQTEAGRRMWVFEDRSFAEIAAALGCHSVRVEDPDEVADALAEAIRTPGPSVLDVVTDMGAFPDPPYGGVSSYAP